MRSDAYSLTLRIPCCTYYLSQGVFSSNHPDQVLPYFEPILEYAREHGGSDAAAYNCTSTGGVGGMPGVVHMPGVIGQHGFIDHDDMKMHIDASFASLNFVNYFKYLIQPAQCRILIIQFT